MHSNKNDNGNEQAQDANGVQSEDDIAKGQALQYKHGKVESDIRSESDQYFSWRM